MINWLRAAVVWLQLPLASITFAQAAVSVVEYYNLQLDAYFITGRVGEQAALDSLPTAFRRTGATFQAVAANVAPADLESVCRFYISFPPPNYTSSHFYGRASTDCGLLVTTKPPGFSFEGYDFAIKNPVGSACPSTHPIKVYRAFRSLSANKTPNHRYSTSAASHAVVVASGWNDEGVAFCVSGATDVAGSSPPPSAAGVWTGKTSSNRNVFGIVPPDGQAWVMYTDTAGSNGLAGAVQGTVSWSGNSWTLTNARDFSLESRSYFSVSGNGQYSTRSFFNGTLNYPALGQLLTFTSSYNSAFEMTPSVSAIAGTYAGQASSFANTENATIVIGVNGTANGRSSGGCNFLGTVAAYNGANLYRISVTFQGGLCIAGTATLGGVVYYDAPSRNLYGLIVDSGRTTPFFFIGAR